MQSENKSDNNSKINNFIKIEAKSLTGREGVAGSEIIKKLDQFDLKITKEYKSKSSSGVRLFEKYISLLVIMKLAINYEINGFQPKFNKNTDYSHVLDISISGAFRSLRIARSLMTSGYFAEAHATLRMAVQWMETALILEGNSRLASSIIKLGSYKKLPKNEKQKAINSKEQIKQLHRGMMKSFGKFSQGTHVTATSINLSRVKDAELGRQVTVSGLSSGQMWEKDTLALAVMARNSLNIFVRHFNKVPRNWEQTRQKVNSSFDKILEK